MQIFNLREKISMVLYLKLFSFALNPMYKLFWYKNVNSTCILFKEEWFLPTF